jgi:predicted HicB family RNase H-like nuclease
MPKLPRPGKSAKEGGLNKPVIALADFDKPESASFTPMNFRVPETFHREFKMYAAQHGISMVDLLQESFRVLKEVRGR